MFNLKKAQAQFVSSFQPKVTVKMIHDEFDSAVDQLINKIINYNESSIENRRKLKSMGFSASKPVSESEVLLREIDHQKSASENAHYHKANYPFNKFITHSLVADICKKYGLLFGEASRYIGDIPEKNIKEITDFKLREDDILKYECGWHEQYNYTDPRTGNTYMMFKPIGEKTNTSVWGYCCYPGGYDFTSASLSTTSVPAGGQEMRICAPQKSFNMNRFEVSADGFTLSAKDPIVLQPVKGGYLIVSKWGDEASDEALLNEVDN